MSFREDLNRIIKSHNGYITSKDLFDKKIPSIYLSRYVKEKHLVHIVRGFYADKSWIVDPYVIFQHIYPKYIYSYNSAVFLHGLGDLFPNYLEVTGPLNYRPLSKTNRGIISHTGTTKKIYNLGITEVKTNLGNTVKVYDQEKTICDFIRYKDKIEAEVYAKALNAYAKSQSKDINKLMYYAKQMGIENKVRNQMEVILNAN